MAEESNTNQQYSPPVPEEHSRELTPEETREELKEAIKGSNDVLVSASTVLTVFPDTITLDRAKLTIFRRTFLKSGQVMSMRVEDLLNVTAAVGPFFGSVKIISRVLNAEKPHRVGHFWRDDAIRVKRITQGYIIALQRKIDCSSLDTDELVKLLEQLGEDDHTESAM